MVDSVAESIHGQPGSNFSILESENPSNSLLPKDKNLEKYSLSGEPISRNNPFYNMNKSNTYDINHKSGLSFSAFPENEAKSSNITPFKSKAIFKTIEGKIGATRLTQSGTLPAEFPSRPDVSASLFAPPGEFAGPSAFSFSCSSHTQNPNFNQNTTGTLRERESGMTRSSKHLRKLSASDNNSTQQKLPKSCSKNIFTSDKIDEFNKNTLNICNEDIRGPDSLLDFDSNKSQVKDVLLKNTRDMRNINRKAQKPKFRTWVTPAPAAEFLQPCSLPPLCPTVPRNGILGG